MRLVPKNAQIEIPTHNEAARKTLTQAQILDIENEIKFLHKKKQKLNTTIPHLYIYNANIWQQTWNNIEQSINQQLHKK
jgi:hypothetical protein